MSQESAYIQSLPLIAGKLSSLKANNRSIESIITDNLNLLLFILLPLAITLCFLSYPIYGVFFNFDKTGALYLKYNIIQSVLLGLSIDLLTIMQALRMSKKATKNLMIGLMIKLILQFPLVYLFQAIGAIVATGIAFAVILILGFKDIWMYYSFNLTEVRIILVTNVIFFLIVYFISKLFSLFSNVDTLNNKLTAILFVAIIGSIYLIIYLVLSNRFEVTKQLFRKKLGYKYFRYKHFK